MERYRAVFVLVISGAWGAVCPVLSEIAAAPPTGRPEWVELADLSGVGVDLRGWSLGDGFGWRSLDSSAYLPAGGRLVLASDCPELRRQFGTASVGCASPVGWNQLSVEQDRVVLRRADGSWCDSVGWNAKVWGDWPSGRSRERIDLDRPGNDPGNWVASSAVGGGTPGWEERRALEPLGGPTGVEVVVRRIRPGVRAGLVKIRAPWNLYLGAEVYDLSRRRVANLWSGQIPASGELAWDGGAGGRPVAPGVYLLLLELGSTATKVEVRHREWLVVEK